MNNPKFVASGAFSEFYFIPEKHKLPSGEEIRWRNVL
jgi:hypothetical protein